MKISICIPQYNRIEYLKINLEKIALQKKANIEVIISDDASTDDTELQIAEIQETFPFPLLYYRFDQNQGYDRNLRKSLELANGEYCIILGNDDTLADEFALNRLVIFLKKNDMPEVGFCNSADYLNINDIQVRASKTAVIGTGKAIALKYYSSFSFVAGIILKKSAFDNVNTSKLDGSIYVQIYLACVIILNGGRLFTIQDTLVLKDVRVDNNIANSYLDNLPRLKKEYKVLDAGLPSYAFVCATAFKDSGITDQLYYYKVVKRIYLFTYPFWLFDYRNHSARIAAIGLKNGLKPKVFKEYGKFSFWIKAKLNVYYTWSTIIGLYLPLVFFNKLKKNLYKIAKL